MFLPTHLSNNHALQKSDLTNALGIIHFMVTNLKTAIWETPSKLYHPTQLTSVIFSHCNQDAIICLIVTCLTRAGLGSPAERAGLGRGKYYPPC